MNNQNNLKWKKYHPLSDKNAFICLVDHMGDDSSIVQAARVSYGKDTNLLDDYNPIPTPHSFNQDTYWKEVEDYEKKEKVLKEQQSKNRQLIRYLMNHSHTTPFEMVEIKFMVQVPMDCWRQWIRHRTASVNEYSTRYTEALEFFQVTNPSEWRLQATDNKQGSSGFLEEYPRSMVVRDGSEFDSANYYIDTGFTDTQVDPNEFRTPGEYLSKRESDYHQYAEDLYEERLALGVAKEQARKDLPLSTYTRAYWKCDLHNIFNFLRLRMDSHAQLEIRSFANSMFEIVKQLCPMACEAFEDYVLHAKRFSRMEVEILKEITGPTLKMATPTKPTDMTDREWKEFLDKLT